MTIKAVMSSELERSAVVPLSRLVKDRFASRLFQKDATLWGPAAEEEASRRLGWVDPFSHSERVLREAEQLREDLQKRSITRIVLCGMGGSSLGPEVIAREAAVALTVVDSTHPDVVRRAFEGDLEHTAVVVSSKSGGTLETATHSNLFRETFKAAGLDPAVHMVYVTDPGSPFADYAKDGYRVFLADPTVGGRYSALTAFGIVPTVLAGANMGRVLDEARAARETLRLDSPENPALRLASAIMGAAPEQFVLLLAEPAEAQLALGDWVEQLVAESTGKEGRGFLPIALQPGAFELSNPPANSLVVNIASSITPEQGISLTGTLGEQLLLWEVATAALGALMRINPFDQPDVEAAKIAAHAALSQEAEPLAENTLVVESELVNRLRQSLPTNGFVAIQAFVDPDSPQGTSVVRLREHLARELGAPVALGWGPRYLHSTGQLHKGGPALGVFLQVVDSSAEDLLIPDGENGLVQLLHAQANGDRKVLESRGRTVLVVST